MKTKCLRIPRISVEMSWIRFGGEGSCCRFLFVVVVWKWCQCWCSVCCRFSWEVLRALMTNDPSFSSPVFLKPYSPPGETPKKKSPLGFSQPTDPTGNAVLGCKKTKITPQKPANEPAEPFVMLLILGRKWGLKNCEALRGPQWELDPAFSF